MLFRSPPARFLAQKNYKKPLPKDLTANSEKPRDLCAKASTNPLSPPRRRRSPPPPTRRHAAPLLPVQIEGHGDLRRRFLSILADSRVLGCSSRAGILEDAARRPKIEPPQPYAPYILLERPYAPPGATHEQAQPAAASVVRPSRRGLQGSRTPPEIVLRRLKVWLASNLCSLLLLAFCFLPHSVPCPVLLFLLLFWIFLCQ